MVLEDYRCPGIWDADESRPARELAPYIGRAKLHRHESVPMRLAWANYAGVEDQAELALASGGIGRDVWFKGFVPTVSRNSRI